ncbi:MAG: gamma carbonic anhydrase family protein [Firmicutes bacterium]|nr:gamma carbonic anhydrase family protein [Bacillota bacterium]
MFIEFNGKKPRIARGAYISPTAVLIGDVTVEEGASIWFGAVLRGDFGKIVVGKNSSVQDNCVVHLLPNGETIIGEEVTVAHGAILHNCTVKKGAVIGMNATILDFAEIGEYAMIAAGSVVVDKTIVPDRHLAAGTPAVVKKKIDGTSLWWIEQSAKSYQALARKYITERDNRDVPPL